ncbi:MAG: hypothetical protein QOD90_1112 [Mycobacterium sp.]|nr:hypothetical protein [Mycobacterium sp.]
MAFNVAKKLDSDSHRACLPLSRGQFVALPQWGNGFRLVTGGQRLAFLELQRTITDAQSAGARLGDKHL